MPTVGIQPWLKIGTIEAIQAAIEEAKASGKPCWSKWKLLFGYGSPNKQGTNAVHGAGADETAAASRQALGWDYEPFEIPAEVYADFKEMLQTVVRQHMKHEQN